MIKNTIIALFALFFLFKTFDGLEDIIHGEKSSFYTIYALLNPDDKMVKTVKTRHESKDKLLCINVFANYDKTATRELDRQGGLLTIESEFKAKNSSSNLVESIKVWLGPHESTNHCKECISMGERYDNYIQFKEYVSLDLNIDFKGNEDLISRSEFGIRAWDGWCGK